MPTSRSPLPRARRLGRIAALAAGLGGLGVLLATSNVEPSNCLSVPPPAPAWAARRHIEAAKIAAGQSAADEHDCAETVESLEAARLAEAECRVSQRALAWLVAQDDSYPLVFSPHALTLALAVLAAGAPREHLQAYADLLGGAPHELLRSLSAAERMHRWALPPTVRNDWAYESDLTLLFAEPTRPETGLLDLLAGYVNLRALPAPALGAYTVQLPFPAAEPSQRPTAPRSPRLPAGRSGLGTSLHVAGLWKHMWERDGQTWTGGVQRGARRSVLSSVIVDEHDLRDLQELLDRGLLTRDTDSARHAEGPMISLDRDAEFALQLIVPEGPERGLRLPTADYACPQPLTDARSLTRTKGQTPVPNLDHSSVHVLPMSAFLGDTVAPPSCLLEGRGHDPRIEDIVHPVALSFRGARINLPPENPPLPKRIRPFKRTRTGPFCSSANLDQLRSLRARFIDEPPEVHSIEPPYAFLFYNAVTGAIYYWAWITGEE